MLKPLDEFIDQALYDKKKGYYNNKNPFGFKGDYITSPSISRIFSEIITIWIILFWQSLNSPKKFNVVELGAGNGDMMLQIIKSTLNFEKFEKSVKYYIYERSDFLKKIQKKKIKNYKIKWINNINDIEKDPTLFIGNEFLDSFPIKQFEKINGNWFEKYVQENLTSNTLKNVKINKNKYEKIVGFQFLKNQKFFEISLNQIDIIKKLSKFVIKNGGGILFIDYGYDELKSSNTLQALKDHKKVDYLKNKGNADITHLINFNFLKNIFKRNNLQINGFTSQGNFLKNLGIFERAEIISKNLSFTKKADIFYRINRLTNNSQMGQLFKVIFASKKNNFNIGFNENEI